MPGSAISQSVTFLSSVPAEVDTDLLIFPVAEGEPISQAISGLDHATNGAVARAVSSREIQGKPYELFLTPISQGWRTARVAVVGCGRAGDLNLERLRRVATAAGLAAKQRRVGRIAFVHRLPDAG